MFARVQTLNHPVAKLEQLTETGRTQLPAAHGLQGFKGFYYLIDRENEKGMVISLWETEQDLRELEANTAMRERTAAEAGITPPPSEVFEVVLHAA